MQQQRPFDQTGSVQIDWQQCSFLSTVKKAGQVANLERTGDIICFTSWKNSKLSGSGLNGNMIFDHEPLDFGVREPISGQSHLNHLSSVQFPCWLTIGSGIKKLSKKIGHFHNPFRESRNPSSDPTS